MTKFDMTFTKNTDGKTLDVAKIQIVLDCPAISIDGNEIGAETIQYLVAYGIRQTLADSYAAKTDEAEARKAFADKLRKVLDGDYSYRDGESGRNADPIRVEMRKLAETAILGGKSRGAWVKANGENADKLLSARISKVMEANEATLRAKATELVAARKNIGEIDLSILDESEETELPVVKAKTKKAA